MLSNILRINKNNITSHLKSGIPHGVEIPAPVMTTTFLQLPSLISLATTDAVWYRFDDCPINNLENVSTTFWLGVDLKFLIKCLDNTEDSDLK